MLAACVCCVCACCRRSLASWLTVHYAVLKAGQGSLPVPAWLGYVAVQCMRDVWQAVQYNAHTTPALVESKSLAVAHQAATCVASWCVV